MKPTFVVVGAEKAGTTSLYHYLSQHPDIYLPPVKQLNYLIHHPAERSLFQGPDITYKNACRSREEYFQTFAHAPEGSVIGEITHIYLFAPESPGLIRNVLGTPKIIAIIRNPIDRAYAQYVFHRELGLEPAATFEEALEAEPARTRARWDPVFNYMGRGFYGAQLSRYYDVFEASNIRVYKFEDFFQHPKARLADLYGFVGADPSYVPDLSKKFIPGGDPRAPEFVASESNGVPTRKPVSPELRRRLIEDFAADVQHTERLTGLDLSDWLRE